QAQADRTGLRLGQAGWQYPAGDGAWLGEGGPAVRAEHDRLQPGPHADLGTGVSAEWETGVKRGEIAPHPASEGLVCRIFDQSFATVIRSLGMTTLSARFEGAISAAC